MSASRAANMRFEELTVADATRISEPRSEKYSVMLTRAPYIAQPSAHTAGIAVAAPVNRHNSRSITPEE